MKTREQNTNNKRKDVERFDWFIERIQTCVDFGWLRESTVKKLHARELSRNQSILCFNIILQHDWSIEQCHLHFRVFFGGKTKSPCFDLFIHWLIKQITNTYRNHFSRSYENRSLFLNTAQCKILCSPEHFLVGNKLLTLTWPMDKGPYNSSSNKIIN